MKKGRIILSLLILSVALCLFGCAQTEGSGLLYRQVTQEQARQMMETQTDYIILDVRTVEEYDEGHIEGAVCVPNEEITGADIPELPDKDQLIFVYCRSGRRSKEAAKKLADMGYRDIVEFGGIIEWMGETAAE